MCIYVPYDDASSWRGTGNGLYVSRTAKSSKTHGCPSWSKGSDLRPDVYVRVGSNPTPCTKLP